MTSQANNTQSTKVEQPYTSSFSLGKFVRRNGTQLGIFGVFVALWIFFIVMAPNTFLRPNIYISFMSTIPFFALMALPAPDYGDHCRRNGFIFHINYGNGHDFFHVCLRCDCQCMACVPGSIDHRSFHWLVEWDYRGEIWHPFSGCYYWYAVFLAWSCACPRTG